MWDGEEGTYSKDSAEKKKKKKGLRTMSIKAELWAPGTD